MKQRSILSSFQRPEIYALIILLSLSYSLQDELYDNDFLNAESPLIKGHQEFARIDAEMRGLTVTSMTSSHSCKDSCIDQDQNFCPSADMSAGYCCASTDNCPRSSICSNDINGITSLKYWACPFGSNCGSSYMVTPPSSPSQYTQIQYGGSSIFVVDNICQYIVQWPSGSKTGDKLRVDINILQRANVYLISAPSYTATGATQMIGSQGNSYYSTYPNQMYIVFLATQIFTGNFNFWAWYRPCTSNCGGSTTGGTTTNTTTGGTTTGGGTTTTGGTTTGGTTTNTTNSTSGTKNTTNTTTGGTTTGGTTTNTTSGGTTTTNTTTSGSTNTTTGTGGGTTNNTNTSTSTNTGTGTSSNGLQVISTSTSVNESSSGSMTVIIIVVVVSVAVLIAGTSIFLFCYIKKRNIRRKTLAQSDISQITPTEKDQHDDHEDIDEIKRKMTKETKVHPMANSEKEQNVNDSSKGQQAESQSLIMKNENQGPNEMQATIDDPQQNNNNQNVGNPVGLPPINANARLNSQGMQEMMQQFNMMQQMMAANPMFMTQNFQSFNPMMNQQMSQQSIAQQALPPLANGRMMNNVMQPNMGMNMWNIDEINNMNGTSDSNQWGFNQSQNLQRMMTPMGMMGNAMTPMGMYPMNNNMMGGMGNMNAFNGWDLSELQDINSFMNKYGLGDQNGNFNFQKMAMMYGPNVKLFQSLNEQALQDPSILQQVFIQMTKNQMMDGVPNVFAQQNKVMGPQVKLYQNLEDQDLQQESIQQKMAKLQKQKTKNDDSGTNKSKGPNAKLFQPLDDQDLSQQSIKEQARLQKQNQQPSHEEEKQYGPKVKLYQQLDGDGDLSQNSIKQAARGNTIKSQPTQLNQNSEESDMTPKQYGPNVKLFNNLDDQRLSQASLDPQLRFKQQNTMKNYELTEEDVHNSSKLPPVMGNLMQLAEQESLDQRAKQRLPKRSDSVSSQGFVRSLNDSAMNRSQVNENQALIERPPSNPQSIMNDPQNAYNPQLYQPEPDFAQEFSADLADSAMQAAKKKGKKKKKKKINTEREPDQQDPGSNRSNNQLSEAQERFNALRLQRQMPPLIHGAMGVLTEQKPSTVQVESKPSFNQPHNLGTEEDFDYSGMNLK